MVAAPEILTASLVAACDNLSVAESIVGGVRTHLSKRQVADLSGTKMGVV